MTDKFKTKYLVTYLISNDDVDLDFLHIFDTLGEVYDFILECMVLGDISVGDRVGIFPLNRPLVPELGYKVTAEGVEYE